MYIVFKKRLFFILDSGDALIFFTLLSFIICNHFFSRQEKKKFLLAQPSKKDDKNSFYRGGSDEIALTIQISLRELIRLRCHAMFFKFFQKFPKPVRILLINVFNFLRKKKVAQLAIPLLIQASEQVANPNVQSIIVVKNVIIVMNNPAAPALGVLLGSLLSIAKKPLSWVITILGTFFVTRSFYQQRMVNNDEVAYQTEIKESKQQQVNELNSKLSDTPLKLKPAKKQLEMQIMEDQNPVAKQFINVPESESTQQALEAAARLERHKIRTEADLHHKKNRNNSITKYELEAEMEQIPEFNHSINDLKFKN
jgi:hypothetical protein